MCLDLMNLRSDSVVDHTLLYYQHNLQKYRTPLWIHRFLGLLACCMRTVYSCLLHCCMRSCKRKNISGKKRKQCFNIYSQVLRSVSLSAIEISKLISPSTAHRSSVTCSGHCYVFQSLFAYVNVEDGELFCKAKNNNKGQYGNIPFVSYYPPL